MITAWSYQFPPKSGRLDGILTWPIYDSIIESGSRLVVKSDLSQLQLQHYNQE